MENFIQTFFILRKKLKKYNNNNKLFIFILIISRDIIIYVILSINCTVEICTGHNLQWLISSSQSDQF